MGVFQLIHHGDVVQFDVEVLVDALEGAANGDVILELNSDFVVDQRLEEAAMAGRQLSRV